MNSKAVYRLLFHGIVTIVYFCAVVKYQSIPPLPHQKRFGGRFKYLTYWNLIVQFSFFTLSCIMDFMKSSSSNYNKLTRFRDKFYAGIALPYAVFVVMSFWTLYGINRELIFPIAYDDVFPQWLNHVCHTAILPVILFETYILKHRHPRKKEGIKITIGFALSYLIWILFLGLAMDVWVYPVLQIINWMQRAIFIVGSVLFVILLYFIGERINCFFWGENVVQKDK